MTGKAPNRPGDTTDKLVEELLRQLPYADPNLKGDPQTPPERPRPAFRSPRPVPPGWQRSWGWVTLALALCAGLAHWPYARSCGVPLYGYLSVVTLLPAIAFRAAIASWTDRRAVAHVFAVLMVFGGVGFAAEVVLPRVHYAQEEASWQCASAATGGSAATTPGPASGPAVATPADSLGLQEADSQPVNAEPVPSDTTSP
jgi:hypothetical protein